MKTRTQLKEEKEKELEEKKRPVINNVTNEYKTINNNITHEDIEKISQEATAKALLVYEEKRQQRKAEKKARLEEQKKKEEMNKTINLAMVGGMIDFGGGYRKKKNSIFG
jgi:ABC-type methionine transport system ATPase subunit